MLKIISPCMHVIAGTACVSKLASAKHMTRQIYMHTHTADIRITHIHTQQVYTACSQSSTCTQSHTHHIYSIVFACKVVRYSCVNNIIAVNI